MPFIGEPIFPMANNDLAAHGPMIISFPVRHAGKGKVTFILRRLEDGPGNVVVDFLKSIFTGWIGEYMKLRQRVPNGQIARITLFNTEATGGTALKQMIVASSLTRSQYLFEFDLPDLPSRETWRVQFENLTNYHLFFRFEVSIPKNREDQFSSIDLELSSRLIGERLAGLSMVLDTANGSSIVLPMPNTPPLPFMLRPMTVPKVGVQISVTDLRTNRISARYALNTNAPSGIALNIDLDFENEGHEGRIQLQLDRNQIPGGAFPIIKYPPIVLDDAFDIQNLRLALSLPLSIANGKVSYDVEHLDCTPNFDDLDISGFPDSIIDLSRDVKEAIKNSVLAALKNPNTASSIGQALSFLFSITTGIAPGTNDVIGAEQANGQTRLHLITTHPE